MRDLEETARKIQFILASLGITPAVTPTLRAKFKVLLHLMSRHLEKHLFLLGNTISIADFAFYGSFYAHLGRGYIPSPWIKTTTPLIWEWIKRVGGAGRYAGLNVERWEAISRTLLNGYTLLKEQGLDNNDEIPETSSAVARLLLEDYIDVLEDHVRYIIGYLHSRSSSSPNAVRIAIPRSLGENYFRVPSGNGEESCGERHLSTHAT